MVCVLNSCKVIFGILNHNRLDKTGADTFILLLISTVIKLALTISIPIPNILNDLDMIIFSEENHHII